MNLFQKNKQLFVALTPGCFGVGIGSVWSQPIELTWTRLGSAWIVGVLGMALVNRFRYRVDGNRRGLSLCQQRRDRELEQIKVDHAAMAELNQVIARMAPAAKTTEPLWSRRAQPRVVCELPVTIQRLQNRSADSRRSRERIAAQFRNVSRTGFGLQQRHPVMSRFVILDFFLPDGGAASVVAEMIWSRPCADGSFHCGGKFLQVLQLSAGFSGQGSTAEASVGRHSPPPAEPSDAAAERTAPESFACLT